MQAASLPSILILPAPNTIALGGVATENNNNGIRSQVKTRVAELKMLKFTVEN